MLVFGIIAGAGLPALFAVGVRAQAVGAARRDSTADDDRWQPVSPTCASRSSPLAVVLGVLFVARDFIGHHTGWYILGAKAA